MPDFEAFVSRLSSLAAGGGVTNIDLSVTKTDSADPVFINNNLTYTIVVTNNGPANATGVVLTDTLPTGVTYVSNDSGCTEAAGTVTCNIGGLNNGNAAEDTVNIVVTPTAAGTITNTASATATQTDTNTANNTATAQTSVAGGTSDLSVTKTANPDPALVDTNLTYTVVVTNGGPNAAGDVTLTDTLPPA